jgi:integrase
MLYICNRKGNYYYNRRVPEFFSDLDKRDTVRLSLGTKCERTAWRKAAVADTEVQAYWQELADTNQPHHDKKFRQIIRTLRRMNFTYKPMAVLVAAPIDEVVARVKAAANATKKQVEALLGAKPEPQLPLSKVMDRYWDLSKDKIINKTEQQVRKWRVPRIRIMANFIGVVGDKDFKELNRDDITDFRDWWLDRIKKEDKAAASANRDIFTLKGILDTINGHINAGLDIEQMFRKIKLDTRFKRKRLSLSSDQIRAILHSPKLDGLNTEAKWFLYAMADTGARSSEIVGLLPEDIHLNVPIPYIAITDRKERSLKTPHSERIIPLVGYALEAFKACPKGFPHYRDRPDTLSNTANKFLRLNGLLPSDQHSVYSMRHSFQNRMLTANVCDIMQAGLMGHKYTQRPQYGEGGELKEKLDWLNMICLKQA